MDYRSIVRRFFAIFFVLVGSAPIFADVTYWLHSSVPSDVAASVQEAVAIYNKHGSFNKHLVVYFDTGVPTAQANYDGVITFGGSRNSRVALHEMGHTVGIGTYWGSPSYSSLMVGGVWQAAYGRTLAIEMGGYADGLHGDGTHIWPWGLNYDSEDSFIERIKHVRIMAATRCDMGIASIYHEPVSQIVPLGEIAVFSVASPTASGYQWYKNGTPLTNGGDISGATSATLQIANVDLADVGNYYCAVTGANETLNSRPRRLIIEQQVGQWNFDGNANNSTGSNHGTTAGSPTYPTGKIGQAIDLDGIDDLVTLPAGVADAKDITVAAWVYWDGGNDWQRIFDFGTSTSQNMFLTPKTGSVMRFAIKNGGSEQIVETTQLAIGQWVHVAITLRQNVATLYVAGKPVATNNAVMINPIDFYPDKNYIGKSQWPDPLFNGRVDDFRIYNYALPGSEIWDLWGQSANHAPLFNADPLILPDGNVTAAYVGQTLAVHAGDADSNPLTYSKLSGPAWLSVASNGTLSGTPAAADCGENSFVVRVTDSSGATDDVALIITVNGLARAYYQLEDNANDGAGTNHGTATGNPAYTTGTLGQAIDLDGTDDYVTLPAGVVNTAAFTIAAWINWDGGGQWQRIFDFGNNTNQYLFLTPRSGGNTLRFVIKNGTEQQLNTSQLATGQWVHVAVTLSGNTGRLYVNGQFKDVNTAITIDPLDFNPTLNYIGKSQWPDPLFNGRIDDFRIYNYAMSSAQIALLSLPPSFTGDPIGNLGGIEFKPYSGLSLATYVNDPQGTGGLTFSKASGPNWLAVAADGTLSGIPNDSNAGVNTFTVRVANQAGLFDTAQMTIQVANTYSGILGADDLLGLASQWLMQGCTDSPACDGADLDGDTDVTFSDFSILSTYWLADEDLQLDLKLDETDGTAAMDDSIYSRPGVLTNGPTWSTPGKAGGSLSFDGIDDYVQIPDYYGIGATGGRTTSLWVKTSSTGKSQTLMQWGSNTIGQLWLTYITTDNRVTVAASSGGVHSTQTITDGQWHHIVSVLDEGQTASGQIRLYIDGQLDAVTYTETCTIHTAQTVPVQLGAFLLYSTGSRVYYLQGMLDEARIYNRALSETEIAALAQ